MSFWSEYNGIMKAGGKQDGVFRELSGSLASAFRLGFMLSPFFCFCIIYYLISPLVTVAAFLWQGRAVAARQPHKLEVAGASPVSATIS